ncbi:MAG: outer membrane protein assembly factor BamB family protein [Planctomycetota bacterium]
MPVIDRASRLGDYPQFYGPRRDATLPGPRLARDWRSSPPRQLWRREVGEAWSSFAVVGTAAMTQEQRGEEEVVVRYDLESGRQVWAHADRTGLITTVGGRGPRATPTIAGGRVYALGATGILNCLELESGELVWSRNVVDDHQVRLADYGMPSSPLLVGDLVVVQLARVGRSLVAYRRSDGEPVWRAGEGSGSYSSPVLATLGGIQQVLIVNQRSIAGHLPESGELLWREEWPHPGEKITPPLLLGDDRLLVSAGYGAGSRLFRLRPGDEGLLVEELWRSPRLKSKFASMVLYQSTVYGLDDGVLTALDPDSGQRLWKRGRYGHGQMILVGDLLLIQSEKGYVVLVEATPKEHRELARLEALNGKTWNPPALAGRHLLVRNNREAACYELPVE